MSPCCFSFLCWFFRQSMTRIFSMLLGFAEWESLIKVAIDHNHLCRHIHLVQIPNQFCWRTKVKWKSDNEKVGYTAEVVSCTWGGIVIRRTVSLHEVLYHHFNFEILHCIEFKKLLNIYHLTFKQWFCMQNGYEPTKPGHTNDN